MITTFDELFYEVLILLSNIDKCECTVEFHAKHFVEIRIRLYQMAKVKEGEGVDKTCRIQ